MRWISARLGRAFQVVISPFVKVVDSGLNLFYRTYPRLLRSALRHRVTVLAAAAVLVLLSVGMLRTLGVELIPPINQGEFSFQITLPEGTPLARTEDTMKSIESKVRSLGEIETCMILVGRNANVSWTSAESYENSAVINVKVKPTKDIKAAENLAADDIRTVLDRYPDLQYKMQRPSLFSFRTPIEVEVHGDALDETSAAAEKLEAKLKMIPGLTDIKSSWEKGSPEGTVWGQLLTLDISSLLPAVRER